jgi:hypothetical protein
MCPLQLGETRPKDAFSVRKHPLPLLYMKPNPTLHFIPCKVKLQKLQVASTCDLHPPYLPDIAPTLAVYPFVLFNWQKRDSCCLHLDRLNSFAFPCVQKHVSNLTLFPLHLYNRENPAVEHHNVCPGTTN